jgi:O-antigen ligase
MSIKSTLNKYLPVALLIPLLFGDLARLRVSGVQFINSADVIVPAVVLWGSLRYKPWQDHRYKSYLTWLAILSATLFASLIWRIADVPFTQLAAAALYPIRLTIFLALPLILIPHFNQYPLSAKQTTRALMLTLLTLALAGLLQMLVLPNLQILELIGYDPHYFRLVSTWLDPNFLGAGLVCAILLTLASDSITRREKGIALSIFTMALILTFSRSAYIMAGCALLTYALLRRSLPIFVGLLLAAAITFLIYTIPRTQIDTSRNIDRAISADLRLKSYGQAIVLFQQHPITGIGYNLIRYEKQTNNMILDTQQGGNSGAGIDSTWLLILATTGLPGFLIFLAFWIRQAFFLIDYPHANKNSKPFSTLIKFLKHASALQHAALALLFAWGIHAWFINSLIYPYLLIIWTIVFSRALVERK